VQRITLLVVPRWHGGRVFTEDGEFVSWLRERAAEGHEICLHGFCHRAERVTGGPLARFVGELYTAREGEFFQIGYREAEEKLRQSLVLFERVGLPVCGFTPPAWLLSAEGRKALRRLGLHYTTSLNHLELLRERRRLRAPTLVFSSRSAWRRAASRAWVRFALHLHRRSPILRVAAHPVDFAYPAVEKALFSLIERAIKVRIPCTYQDVVRAAIPENGHMLCTGLGLKS
jgi:predicted deacetylase